MFRIEGNKIIISKDFKSTVQFGNKSHTMTPEELKKALEKAHPDKKVVIE